MNAWPPQASYPCGNFSDTSRSKLPKTKGSIGRAFTVRSRTETLDRASICPFALRGVSVPAELALGHLRYLLTDVPPQSNSPPGTVLGEDRGGPTARARPAAGVGPAEGPRRRRRRRGRPPLAIPDRAERRGARPTRTPPNRVSEETTGVAVFHRRHPQGRGLPPMLHPPRSLTESD